MHHLMSLNKRQFGLNNHAIICCMLCTIFLVGVNAFVAFLPYRTTIAVKSRNISTLTLSLRLDFDDKEGLTFDASGPRIIFKGQKISYHVCQETEPTSRTRTLLHYLALPAEEYSVLDAGTIAKKTGGENNQFTCTLDPISFFGNNIVAQIEAEVDVSPYPEGKSVIQVTGCTLDGSRLAKFANGSFDVSCTNVVRAIRSDTRKGKDFPTLSVDCQLEISALVPQEGRWLPKRLVGKSGSIVIQQMLNIIVPRFVKQLAKDYSVWSAGDDSRAPVQDISMSSGDTEGVGSL
mmetsp:Transcript_6366/g.9313  ORF Transcript_6366/g.9313 Transcript_6366/m.9313 type:complete len:291 (+) Transcript_6366:158-1030(+)